MPCDQAQNEIFIGVSGAMRDISVIGGTYKKELTACSVEANRAIVGKHMGNLKSFTNDDGCLE